MKAEIEAFLESLRIDQGASDKTVEAYRNDLHQFARHVSERTPDQVGSDDVQSFFSRLTAEKQKPASLARKGSALRQFFKFCCVERGLKKNPTENLESPKKARRLPKSLSTEDVTALLKIADTGLPYLRSGSVREHLCARDRAMIYLLYATGLRVSELVGLTVHDVDLEQGYVRVKGKGEKERIAPFAPIAGDLLRAYLENSRPVFKPESEHVFVSQRGWALTRQAFWMMLKEMAAQAGIAMSLSPHVLRHSFATHLLQSGIHLRSLQMLLGHSDLSTTQIYAHVTPDHLQTTHRKYHPRGGG